MAQGDVGDGGVENLHERGQGHGEGDDPRIEARFPGGDRELFGVSHGVNSSSRSRSTRLVQTTRALKQAGDDVDVAVFGAAKSATLQVLSTGYLFLASGVAETLTSGVTDMPGRSRPS